MSDNNEITVRVKRTGTTIHDVYEAEVTGCTIVTLKGADADLVRRYLREPGAWAGATPTSKGDLHAMKSKQLRKETLEMLEERMAALMGIK